MPPSQTRIEAVKSFFKHTSLASALGVALVFCSFSQVAHSEQTAGKDLEVLRIRPNFYVIFGAGGNIAVQLGSTGLVLVNTGRAEAADRVLETIKKITDQPIRYIINTGAHSQQHLLCSENRRRSRRQDVAAGFRQRRIAADILGIGASVDDVADRLIRNLLDRFQNAIRRFSSPRVDQHEARRSKLNSDVSAGAKDDVEVWPDPQDLQIFARGLLAVRDLRKTAEHQCNAQRACQRSVFEEGLHSLNPGLRRRHVFAPEAME